MENLSGGDLLTRALTDVGVELIFGYPGGAALHIYDALFRQNKIKHILVRHEQAAAHAADAYARVTGRVGTVLVTSGPGATNAITGIATAYMDSIPMVIISGQVPSARIGEDAFQETDMMGVSRPVVKHSFMVQDPSEIPIIVKKAYYLASSGRPGPVVIDIPKDMTDPNQFFEYRCPNTVSIRSYTPTVKGHGGQIKKAVRAVMAAKKPIVYIGGGSLAGQGPELLTRLVKKLGVPVTSTLMGLGAYPGTDEQFVGMLGMHGTYESNTAMHNSDVILAVGARFDDRVTNKIEKFCPDATVIHIDIDPTSISKTIAAHIPIVGSVESVLRDMLKMIETSGKSLDTSALNSWWQQINEWRDKHGLYTQNRFDTSGMIMPQEVVQAVYEVTHGDAVVTTDVGQHQMFAAQYYRFDKPRRWVTSGGLGTMGFGIPAAMGAQLANMDETVACFTGEGSVQMCIQELSTCTQYNLPIKIININNQALGMVKQWQDMNYDSRYSEILYEDSLPDFVKLAEAYGHVGMKVTKREELKDKLKECFAMKDRVVFMDIYVDPHEHVYPMQVPLQSVGDMFISRTERT
ncbi:acetolactate synthase, large subunit, biosynthetic type [Candidatus Endobugula sertula]|uniref:Acetolactate synthase n=1 Tax=Candidatus Endobugula sertula TaxID=62101 RepID=A0A1D2QS94_9GAMM|nr:acetolactate synthase, large subunit, biosynthetic type [Candidatus Endobugula sertula]